jgi:hypothetical protein
MWGGRRMAQVQVDALVVWDPSPTSTGPCHSSCALAGAELERRCALRRPQL